jgi:hypothetical protein
MHESEYNAEDSIFLLFSGILYPVSHKYDTIAAGGEYEDDQF